jgi:hypothetical protein
MPRAYAACNAVTMCRQERAQHRAGEEPDRVPRPIQGDDGGCAGLRFAKRVSQVGESLRRGKDTGHRSGTSAGYADISDVCAGQQG